MRVTVKKAKPVEPVIEEVILVLTEGEAKILKKVVSYRMRVANVIPDLDMYQRRQVTSVLYTVWQGLHTQGVHAGDGNSD